MGKTTFSSEYFTDTKPHYELLDGLRGVAAILVLFYHIFEGFSFAEITNGDGDGIIRTLNHGHIAVDFFFILSGFVLSYAYDDRWKKMNTWQFFKPSSVLYQPGKLYWLADAESFLGLPAFPHSKNSNMYFMDGHVEAVSYKHRGAFARYSTSLTQTQDTYANPSVLLWSGIGGANYNYYPFRVVK